MAFRHALRQRNVVPIAAGAVTASLIFLPQPAYAEEPEAASLKRKPIYDDLYTSDIEITPPTTSTSSVPSSTPRKQQPTAATSPSPTDRLTVQVRRVRLQLYQLSLQAEDALNDVASRAFKLEHNLTSTVRSLAPPKNSNEHLMPGLIYVLVAAMAGSILTRNRGIILRSAVPLTFGITAGHYLLPITMTNVEQLVWSWEKQYPVIADTHTDVQERVTRVVETAKGHTYMAIDQAEETLADARRKMEEWVRQGK